MQSLLDKYLQQLTARLDEDRITKLHGALSQLKDAHRTIIKQGYLTQALSAFHTISHLPEQGITGGKPNTELRCIAFLGMATAHIELNDHPQLIAEKIIAAIQADPVTTKQWLGDHVVQGILSQYPNLKPQTCQGSGKQRSSTQSIFGTLISEKDCTSCSGKGYISSTNPQPQTKTSNQRNKKQSNEELTDLFEALFGKSGRTDPYEVPLGKSEWTDFFKAQYASS